MTVTLQFLLAIGLAINEPAGTSCSPVPGADQIWSKPGVHWVFIGELHGSNETPAAFRELVCDAIAQGKHVTVALERPTSEQAALDNILTGKDLSVAKESLLQLPGWKEVLDGRASEAMLRLLVSLRELHRFHPDLKVVAFDAPYSGSPPVVHATKRWDTPCFRYVQQSPMIWCSSSQEIFTQCKLQNAVTTWRRCTCPPRKS